MHVNTLSETWLVTNQQRSNWTRCRMTLPKQRVIAIGTMPHGGKVDLPLGRFVFDKQAPVLEGRARIDCEQGFGLIPLP